MTQEQSWYATMFYNRADTPHRALSTYIEGETWAVQIDGTPRRMLYTIRDVVAQLALVHGIARDGDR